MSKQDELLDHNYDGIQEYDNDLPRWWVYLFLITIVWGVVYAIWFHAPSTPTPEQRLAAGMQEIEALRAKHVAAAPSVTSDGDLLKLVADQAALKEGNEIFATRCAACHGMKGEGLIGPNLTDDFWIHGGKITDLQRVVTEGVLDKGMIAWKASLTPQQINAVVAFVWTLHGTNPENPKAPQGDKVERGS